VAQVARRLAEKITYIAERNEGKGRIIAELGGIDPDVAEAAALAHDFGHPPFGHVGEESLSEVLEAANISEGYEGNAQAFRIVTKLIVRSEVHKGLNPTKATLDALLKYPWKRANDRNSGKKYRKYGYYESEEPEFEWARNHGIRYSAGQKSLEAQIMDLADDIAYSVHDAEDFVRAGLIPLHIFVPKEGEPDRYTADSEQGIFLETAAERRHIISEGLISIDAYKEAFKKLATSIPLTTSYKGTRRDRAGLHHYCSGLINTFMDNVQVEIPTEENDYQCIVMDNGKEKEIDMLKELTWYYVIDNPSLAAVQEGQRFIIKKLFEVYFDAANALPNNTKRLKLFPGEFQQDIQQADTPGKKARVVADLIASMTDHQARQVYHRFTGTSDGSILAEYR